MKFSLGCDHYLSYLMCKWFDTCYCYSVLIDLKAKIMINLKNENIVK